MSQPQPTQLQLRLQTRMAIPPKIRAEVRLPAFPTETQRTLDGKPISSDKWRGIFTLAMNPPTDEAVLRVNPFGIYVMDITWSKVL